MSSYAYTDRDLFSAPEYYHYAPCERPDFLAGWHRTRTVLFEHERVRELAPGWPAPAMVSAESLEAGTLASALASGVRELVEGRDAGAEFDQMLAVLVRKYEVARRIFRRYDREWKRIETEPVAALGTYVLFAAALALRGARPLNPDLQMISTLLKIGDALLSKTVAAFDTWQLMTLRETFQLERAAIGRIGQRP